MESKMTNRFSPVIETETQLRTIYKQPTKLTVAKDIGHIDQHCRRFIELSPFLCFGTMSDAGGGDVTPRGGEPGFVQVLDKNTLAMPDRPGNNRLDSFTNVLRQPSIGLLFFVPGFEDVLRVNGTARITTDPALMERFLAGGKLPIAVLVIEVQQAYLHCTKAIKRAGLWDAAAQVDRTVYPSAGQVLRDHLALDETTAAIDQFIEKDARERLY
jgi:PPOX class probable FMN-dependent enzyme